MNIARFDCFVVANTFSPRTGVSILYVDRFAYVLVKLTDDDGHSGWGETYGAPGVFEAVAASASSLLGRSGSLRALLREVRFGAGGIHGGGFAASAVSLALEELRARQLGVAVGELYGGRVRDDVRAYAASGGYTEGEHPSITWPAELERAVAAGYTALKLRIGGYPIAEEAALLEDLRNRAPDGFDLMADGNAAYVLPQALEMGRVLGDLGFAWYEEPMPQRGYVDYPELTRRLDVTVAGGEGIATRIDADRHLAERFVDLIQPEPVICGGVGDALFIAELAAARGIRATPHTSNSAIGITAGLHVIGGLPNATRTMHAPVEPVLEYGVDASAWRDQLLTEPHTMTGGHIAVPTGPGWGVEIDEAHVRRVAAAHTSGSQGGPAPKDSGR